MPFKTQQFEFFLFRVGVFFVSTLSKSVPGYLSSTAGARWPDLLPPPRPLTSRKERAINRGRRATLLQATHMHTHSYAYNRIFLPASLCTCKAVSRPHPPPPPLCRGHLKYPRCKQSRLQNQTLFLQRPAVHKGQTRTFLLRRPALQGKSTSHILMRNGPFLFS